ncbi:MAG: PAS domain S-box protein [Bacteroidales bacterium]|nr:PAS domain S-box protein [Bacteroidales bacterium]
MTESEHYINLERRIKAIEELLQNADLLSKKDQAVINPDTELLNEVFENSRYAIVILEPVAGTELFKINKVNLAFEQTEDINRQQVIGKTLVEIFPGIINSEVFDIITRVSNTGNSERHPLFYYEDSRIKGWRDYYVMKLSNAFIAIIYQELSEKKTETPSSLKYQLKYNSLYESALALLEAAPGQNLYRLTGNLLSKLACNTYIIVNSYNAATQSLITESISGPGLNRGELTVLLGKNPIGQDYKLNQKAIKTLLNGKLFRVKSDLYKALNTQIPYPVCNEIEELYKINYIYTVGLICDNSFYGNVLLLSSELIAEDLDIINIFLKQASLMLHRSSVADSLKTEKEYFNVTLDSISDAVITTDINGSIVFINNIAESFCECNPAQSIGLPFSSIFNIIDKNNSFNFESILNSVVADKKPVNIIDKIWINTKSGKEIFIQLNIAPIIKENKEIIGIVIVLKDLSELIISNIRQNKNEEKYKKLINEIPLAIISCDLNGNILYVNDVMLNLLGSPSQEATKEINLFSYQPLIDIGFSQHIKQCLQTGEKIIFSNSYTSKWGKTIYFQVHTIPTRDNDNQIIGAMIMGMDTTASKKAEDAIKDSEELFKSITASAYDAIVVINDDGNICFWNKAASKIFGYTQEEIIDKNYELLFLPSPELENFKNGFVNYKNTGQGFVINNTLELTAKKSNNIEFPVEISISAIKYKNKWSVVVIIRDATFRKLQEQALKEAKLKAEEADNLKSAFLANMSHEIRSPLNAIAGFAGLLADSDLSDEERKEYSTLVNNSCSTLSNLINDIIDIAKIEAGQTKINETEFNLIEIINELFDIYKNVLKKENKISIQLKTFIPQDTNNFPIISDPYRIKQILSNLIGNALKFTEEGSIEFGFTIKDDKLEFYTSDTGIGIKPDEQEIIFDRFRQSESAKLTKNQGTGLGLAISKNLSRLLGGDMWVESVFGRGSTFYFTIPYKYNTKPVQVIKKQTVANLNYNWENKTILVVEDIEINFTLIKEYLRKTGVKLLWVTDGKEAIDLCKSDNSIDLILMDIQLPYINGYIATQAIKKINKNIPIIAETAYAMANEKYEILRAGCDDYLAKPLKYEELLFTINKYIDSKKKTTLKPDMAN